MSKKDAVQSAELVFLGGKEPYTTSEIIAERTGIDRRKVRDAIRKYKTDMEAFGRVASYQAPLETNGGTQIIIGYILNEQQATFLLTLLKNTPIVVAFKKELVRQFFEMRRLLLERQSAQWQQARSDGKAVRRLETDAIKAFVDYAAANGSKRAERYYVTFTTMVYKAIGIESGKRRLLPAAALRDLQMIEQVVERAVWSELAAGTEYHEAFQNVKAKVQQVAAFALAPVPERAALSESA